MNKTMIEEIVKNVLDRMDNNQNLSIDTDNNGIFKSMNEAVEAAYIGQQKLRDCTMERKKEFVNAIKSELIKEENINLISKLGVEETRMGNFKDKVIKNRLAVEKTPGIEDLKTEAMAGDNGLTLIELSPFGVIGAITPSTNPSETVICNTIGMIAAGNSVVFAPHPSAKETTITTIKLINKALSKVNAPKNLVVTLEKPSLEEANVMMNHEKITMLVATGGPGVVKAVLSTGKKAIGAGAGNPPAVVDETADIEKAAKDIVDGASFDNNIPCIAEKEVIAVDSIADYLIFNMKKSGAYELTDLDKINELRKLVITPEGSPNKDFIGKDACYILDKIGIKTNDNVKLIIFETDEEDLFVVEELMMPILPVVRVKDVDEAIDLAVKVENGNRHTSMMHSKNVYKLTDMAKRIQTTIFVKNGPSYAGIGVGGEGYTTFTIAGPTGEGLTSAKTFTRKRRCVLVGGFHIK
ncbi:MAG: aldehyde dehydrogenase family protein [Bacillota bacterium]|nr:aldehyde dehydrogenase family protein [Bacillota bacterium]